MKFYHQGKKKSNEPSMFSGCLLLIGFGAIVFLITLLDDLEDAKEYIVEIIFAFIMGGSILISLFSKRGKISNRHIEIKNSYFFIENISIPINDIVLDNYLESGTFKRYHLRDKAGKIAIFSVIKDDLYTYFYDQLPTQINEIEVTSSKYDGPYISVIRKTQNLFYNLDSGKYTINAGEQSEISYLPEVYTYDGNYKLGKPLFKRK